MGATWFWISLLIDVHCDCEGQATVMESGQEAWASGTVTEEWVPNFMRNKNRLRERDRERERDAAKN